MSLFQACQICEIEKRDIYKCPKCSIFYCSLKCYKNEKHSKCSEKFYQEQVKQELSGKKFENGNLTETNREKLEKFLNDDWSGIEEGEPLDSDDEPENEMKWKQNEEEQILKKIVASTIEDYELDDNEIERRLTALGLTDNVEQLLNTLDPDEREVFKKLSSEMQEEELGLGNSCFKK